MNEVANLEPSGEMEETDPYFAFAAFDLFHPPLQRIRSRHAAPETSNIEIERLAKGGCAALKRLAGTERRSSVLCHGRSIRTFDSFEQMPSGRVNGRAVFASEACKVIEKIGRGEWIRTTDLLVPN
jgi:hypothetical protein